MKKNIVLIIVTAVLWAGCSRQGQFIKAPSHFDYEHPDWANEGYPECSGKAQSPIDINTSATIKVKSHEVTFNYAPFNMNIVDNGHTIQVVNTGNNTLIQNGSSFDFKQFHFHHVSEHAVDGVKAAMELHLVHQNSGTGVITVLAVLIEEGAANNTIEQIWNNIPAEKMKEVSTTVPINLNNLLPADKNYYHYMGSLTTPPCSQGINWILLKEPISLSKAQIATFTGLYENNARSLQPLDNRFIIESIP
jgi:carbonic anhydrase